MDGQEKDPERDGVALRIWIPVRSTFLTLAALVGGICIVGLAAMLLLGLKPHIVVSGSMEPTIPTGSLAFARAVDADTVKKGDIVTVPRNFGSGLVTHRVIEIEEQQGLILLTLQGDANTSPDPEPYAVETAGLVTFHIPMLGYVAGVLQTGYGIVGIGLVVLCFVTAFVFDPVRIRHWYALDDDDDDDNDDDEDEDDAKPVSTGSP